MKPWRMGLMAGAVTLLAAGSAVAVKSGELLYIKTRDAQVQDKPGDQGAVVERLHYGAAVTWVGSVPGNKEWHNVKLASGKSGVASKAVLGATKPSTELTRQSSGEPVDAVSFASSGAATKALGAGAEKFGKDPETKLGDATRQLQVVEKLAESVSASDVEKHARNTHTHAGALLNEGAK